MATSPCNNLNIKTLRISQLASIPSVSDNDLIQISQYTGGVYYSKKTTVSSLGTYLLSNGHYTGSFKGDLNLTAGLTGSINLPTTVGTVTSNYLPIKLNGTTYKILLYNV